MYNPRRETPTRNRRLPLAAHRPRALLDALSRELQRALVGVALLALGCDPACVVAGSVADNVEPSTESDCVRVRAQGKGLGVVPTSGDECSEWSACLVALPGESIGLVREHEIFLVNETDGGWAIDREPLDSEGACPLVCE